MASSALTRLVLVVALCMVVSAPIAHAITCGQVTSSLAPCIGYLKGGPLAPGCCPGVKSLASQATTPADRKTACNCLKSAAGSINGLNLNLAAGLPGKCGVSIPFKISPSTNCATVN